MGGSSSTASKPVKTCSKYSNAPIVKFQSEVWKKFKDYEGKVEYYYFGGGLGHGGLCFRIPDSNTVAQAELTVREVKVGDEPEKKMRWYVLVRLSKEWKPKHNEKVHTSTYSWHVGTVLFMVHNFAKKFKNYNMLCNNCNDWKKGVVDEMRKMGPPRLQRPKTLDELIEQRKSDGLILAIETGEFTEV